MKEYIYLIIPLVSIVMAQVIKFIIESIKNKKIYIYRLIDGSGGMPSSHSAFVASITTTIYLLEGADSSFFATSLVFSLVVLYDAVGIRYQTGKQAEVLNKLVDKVGMTDSKNKLKKLKESLGHKPIEVLFGILLGISVSLILTKVLY